MRRKAFTLIELLVVIGIIGVLVTILLPELNKIYNKARLGACQGNLHTLGVSLATYFEDEKYMPVIRRQPINSDEEVNSRPTENNDTDAGYGEPDEEENDWDVLGDQAMQNVWLMIATAYVDQMVFRCQADSEYEERGMQWLNYGWTSEYQYSYGLQWPYSRNIAGTRNQAGLTGNMTGVVATMADYNPAVLDDTIGVGETGSDFTDPSNHTKLGTNLLLANGSVKYHNEETDSLAGHGGDDVYTGGPEEADIVGAMPEYISDPPTGYKADFDTSIALPGREDIPEGP